MKYVLLVLMIIMPTMANADAIEGIYMTNPDSYYRHNGRNQYFENSYEIMIIANDDGSYYVDDLFGGWYCQHLGYGADYAMSGNIEILDDGIVSLKDCYVYSWNKGFSSLKGTYDKASSSFTINEEYDDITFLLTWIKVGEVFKKDGFIYKKEDDNSVSVIKKDDDNKGNIVIPNEVLFDGITYSVTSIDRAFYNCQDIESVTIPNSVLSIGEFCFSHCKNLNSVTFSNGLNSIGDSSFYDCNNLTSIFIPNSVTSIGRSAFYLCTSLTTVNIPQNVSVIEDDSFYGCTNLTSLTISNGVNKIEYEAFTGCTSLTTLFIPKSLTYINNAFYDCIGLTSIIVDSENEVFDSRDNCNAIIETNTNTLILGCKNTKIPNSVSNIGALAFCGCSGLTSLNIPNSVKTIGNDSFYNCINLISVYIPQSIIFIDGYAFDRCTGLTDVYCYAENVPQIELFAFGDKNREFFHIDSTTLHVPATSLDAYIQTEPWSDFGNIVALTDEDPKPTGIHTTSINKNSEGDYYDLNGRIIIPNTNGVYIQKGKKIVIKH